MTKCLNFEALEASGVVDRHLAFLKCSTVEEFIVLASSADYLLCERHITITQKPNVFDQSWFQVCWINNKAKADRSLWQG